MNLRRKSFLVALSVAVATIAAAAGGDRGPGQQSVSVASLLREMVDPDAATYRTDRPWTTRLWSSCDRSSVAPDRPGWFANDDRNKFVRNETNAAGKVEHVLLDAKGPGAIVRFWITVEKVDDGG